MMEDDENDDDDDDGDGDGDGDGGGGGGVCQLLTEGQQFNMATALSFASRTDHHDITLYVESGVL